MEKIIINGELYSLPNGTDSKIYELMKQADSKPYRDEENNTQYKEYNDFLQNIIDSKKKTRINGVYSTNY